MDQLNCFGASAATISLSVCQPPRTTGAQATTSVARLLFPRKRAPTWPGWPDIHCPPMHSGLHRPLSGRSLTKAYSSSGDAVQKALVSISKRVTHQRLAPANRGQRCIRGRSVKLVFGSVKSVQWWW
ncbi:Uncharacterised protein [Mycobacteroides abscessus subsp. abscessus]|nr:Uncharacterised protein [Mycobacteroides abscessus subsp. abscessus]